ncbi:MAG: serine/threonine-protein kinase [Myxococcaceae bacterium]
MRRDLWSIDCAFTGSDAAMSNDRWKKTGESLGGGAQGQAFKVADTTGGLLGVFAMKVARHQTEADQERFVREVETVRKLNHPNIVRVIDSGREAKSKKPFYVMPLYENGDLWAFARKFRSDPQRIIACLRTICDAVAYAHANGVIHRDIKPQNILFGTDWEPVLTDFGICYDAASDRLTADSEWVGPKGFMAPELEGGRVQDVSPRADVYSLGKLFWFLFAAPDENAVIAREDWKVARYRIQQPRIRVLAERWIFPRTIVRHPWRRFPTAGALADALKRTADLARGSSEPISERWGIALVVLSLVLLCCTEFAARGIFPFSSLRYEAPATLFGGFLVLAAFQEGLIRWRGRHERLSQIETLRNFGWAFVLLVAVGGASWWIAGPGRLVLIIRCSGGVSQIAFEELGVRRLVQCPPTETAATYALVFVPLTSTESFLSSVECVGGKRPSIDPGRPMITCSTTSGVVSPVDATAPDRVVPTCADRGGDCSRPR